MTGALAVLASGLLTTIVLVAMFTVDSTAAFALALAGWSATVIGLMAVALGRGSR
jgi:hypothetical protein